MEPTPLLTRSGPDSVEEPVGGNRPSEEDRTESFAKTTSTSVPNHGWKLFSSDGKTHSPAEKFIYQIISRSRLPLFGMFFTGSNTERPAEEQHSFDGEFLIGAMNLYVRITTAAAATTIRSDPFFETNLVISFDFPPELLVFCARQRGKLIWL